MLFVGVLGERGARLRDQSRWHADLLQQVGELVGVLLEMLAGAPAQGLNVGQDACLVHGYLVDLDFDHLARL